MAAPVWMHEIMYFIKTGETSSGGSTVPVYTFVDYDNSFDPTANIEEYAAKYKARKTQPKYKTSRSVSIEFDFDLVNGTALAEFLLANEDVLNAPTEVIRVYPDPDGSTTPNYPAKRGEFVMTQNPIDGEANNPARATGTLDMVGDGWEDGTAQISIVDGVPQVTYTPAS